MKRHIRRLPVVLSACFALLMGVPVGAVKEQIPFSEAAIFFELNDTDGDLGVQFFLDGEDWQEIQIYAPNRRKLVEAKVKGSVKQIGLTELVSESAEPSFDDLSRAEFLALFPAGVYTFMGKTVEGQRLVGVAVLTHNLPDAPEILFPQEDQEVDPANPVVIRWRSVPDPAPPGSVIVGYQVIVEQEDPLRVFQVDLPASANSVTVSPEFFSRGKEAKVEVLAIESSGNKTITEVPFTVAP